MFGGNTNFPFPAMLSQKPEADASDGTQSLSEGGKGEESHECKDDEFMAPEEECSWENDADC